MIGAPNYFASRMWAPRYWPKFGAGITVILNLCAAYSLSLMPWRGSTTYCEHED